MEAPASVDLDALAVGCLRRQGKSLFPLEGRGLERFNSSIAGTNVLITGAAGFIARATLPHVIKAGPRKVHLIDSSENGLAELARELAVKRLLDAKTRLHMSLADITSPLFQRVLDVGGPPDVVLHFAAVKHVRSERDVASALRILDVNVRGTHALLQLFSALPSPPRVFAVSTDKAVRPSSMMGASKALMESLLWAYPGEATSTRFANVLFSAGSITESWLNRLIARDPLSTPIDTYRYFISRREAGRICANAIAAPSGSVTVPSEGSVRLTNLTDLAAGFLAQFSLQPSMLSMDEWKDGSAATWPDAYLPASYPVVCTPRDTSGEKEFEEFRDPLEVTNYLSQDLLMIEKPNSVSVLDALQQLADWILADGTPVSLADIGGLLAESLPNYQLDSMERPSLDSRI